MASFGKKIAALRKDQKMSQTDLARQLFTSVSVISRYERDAMTPSIDVAKKLAAVLKRCSDTKDQAQKHCCSLIR